MQPRRCRQRFLRQGQRRAPLADPLANEPHELARVHFPWRNHPEAVKSLNRQSVTPADNAKQAWSSMMEGYGQVKEYRTAFRTGCGEAIIGDSMHVLRDLPAESVDLILTSPPFALLREKTYGNHDQSKYVDWLLGFAPLVHRVLKSTGSYVIDLGGAYQRGVPTRSVYQFRVLLRHIDDYGFHLAEDFYWNNPSKLPSPIEWVNKRKLRVKDSVNTVWWLSKTEWPKANVSNVLAPYSARMKKLLEDPDAFYQPKERPSGHDIGKGFGKDNGGAIPSNLLQFPNSESNGNYMRLCKLFNLPAHPARFPRALPEFFVKFLTDPGDTVADIFGGSGTTGEVCEQLGRKWKTVDLDAAYVRTSIFRFVADRSDADVSILLRQLDQDEVPTIAPRQLLLA
jgi:site-specific DNA-methyltransferase (cytosine-N4-specific)